MIPWKSTIGMRNRLIHEYFGTDLQLLGKVIKNELPSPRNGLQRIAANLQEQGR